MRTLTCLAAVSLAMLALPACRNPFRTYDDEYGRVVDEAELRTAQRLDMGEGAAAPDGPT